MLNHSHLSRATLFQNSRLEAPVFVFQDSLPTLSSISLSKNSRLRTNATSEQTVARTEQNRNKPCQEMEYADPQNQMLCWKNIGWQTLRRAHKCKEQTTNLRYIIRYIFVSRKPQCGRTLSGLLCGSIVQALHEAFNLHITHAPMHEGGSLLWPKPTHQDYTSSCSH